MKMNQSTIFYLYLVLLNGILIFLRISTGVNGFVKYAPISTILFLLLFGHLLYLFFSKKYDHFIMLWLSFYFASPVLNPSFIDIGSLGLLNGIFLPLMLIISFNPKNKYSLIIMSLIVVSLLSIINVQYRLTVSSLFQFIAPLIFLYFVMKRCKNPDSILFVSLMIAAINIPISAYQVIARPEWGVLSDWRSFRIMGNLFHPNSYSMYLLPVILLVYTKIRDKFNVYLLLLLIALITVDILTFSRIGLLSLIVSIIVFEWLFKSGFAINGKKVALLFLLAFSIFGFTRLDVGDSHLSTESLNERVGIWESIFPLLKGHMFFGNGLGSYELYRSDVVNSLSPHNVYLSVIFEIGLIGLLLILIFIALLLLDLFRGLSKSYGLAFNELGIALIVGILLFSLTDGAPLDQVVSLNAWVMIGCCMIKNRREDE
ncbi:MAG: O-antigen ligase family protein [Candidatus Woesearchaeota archaeon]